MIKRIIFLLLAVLLGLGLQAQTVQKPGGYYTNAIPVSFSPGKSTFTDVRDTREGLPWYYYFIFIPKAGGDLHRTQGNAVYYKMDLATSGNLIIHNWNSMYMGFTTLFLLRPAKPDETPDWTDGNYSLKRVMSFEENEFTSPEYNPEEIGFPPDSFLGYAYLRARNLSAGTYYVVSAGYKYSNGSSPNGNLCTTIIADLSDEIPGEGDIKPEEPNNNPVQYQYDLSGNRIKTILK